MCRRLEKQVPFLIAFLVVFSTLSAFADESTNEETPVINAFYYDWMATSAVPLDISLLRTTSLHEVQLVSTHEKSEFLKLIGSNDFSVEMTDLRYMNGRLLIEFETDKGVETTYFSSRTKLCRLESKTCAEIDEAFRVKLHNFIMSALD